jgi:hypothetical protein
MLPFAAQGNSMKQTLPSFKRIVIEEPKAQPKEEHPEQLDGHVPEIDKTFLFAGKSLFTVTNENTREHFTFKVRARESEHPKGSGQRSRTYFLNVKASGGKYPFRYIGILNPDGTIRRTVGSEYETHDKEYCVGAWASQVIIAAKLIPNNYHINHEGRCGRCARELPKDSEIAKTGIGPECAQLVN